MKHMKKLFAMMLMIASVLFFACSDDEDETLSPEEAKAEMEQLSSDMSMYMDEMETSEGMEALDALMAKPYPFTDVKSNSYSGVLKDIQKYVLPTNYLKLESKEKGVAEEDRFNFELWVGTYDWDAAHEMWVPDFGNPSDKIIVNFPTEGSTTNDATLTIHNYTDVEITETDDYGTYTWYEPTNMVADLYIGDIKVVDISMDAEWVTSGETAGEPTSIDASVYLIPFEFTANFDHTSTSASVDVAINYEESQIFSAGLSAVFETSDMDEAPVNVSGYIQLLKVRVDVSIDVKDLEEIMESMEEEYETPEEMVAAINGEIDAYVTIDGVKAADIELVYDETSEQMFDIVFVYSDGSTESAIPYFESFATDLEGFFSGLEEYYSTWG
ncbi:MAG: hypothetical protein R6V23_03250 [Bacteroidales bacterium]